MNDVAIEAIEAGPKNASLLDDIVPSTVTSHTSP